MRITTDKAQRRKSMKKQQELIIADYAENTDSEIKISAISAICDQKTWW